MKITKCTACPLTCDVLTIYALTDCKMLLLQVDVCFWLWSHSNFHVVSDKIAHKNDEMKRFKRIKPLKGLMRSVNLLRYLQGFSEPANQLEILSTHRVESRCTFNDHKRSVLESKQTNHEQTVEVIFQHEACTPCEMWLGFTLTKCIQSCTSMIIWDWLA
jgi:hypothetical protein